MRLLGPKCQLHYAKCSKLIHILQKIVEVIWHTASEIWCIEKFKSSGKKGTTFVDGEACRGNTGFIAS